MQNILIDMWYGDTPEAVEGITVSFYPNDGVYRGNCLIAGRFVGDYSTSDSLEIEKAFPNVCINWD